MYNLTLERLYPTPYAASALLPLLLLSMSGQKHTPATTTKFKEEYDYIVVGAGTAGSVVASRLAEKDCVTVLLLEAGKSPPKITDIPAIYTFFAKTDLDWNFKTVAQKYTGEGMIDRSFTLSGGKSIGGSSVINGMQNLRGNRKDMDSWETQGAEGWSYEEVLPYFKKLENNVDPEYTSNGYHGIGGPVTVSKPPYDSELKAAIYEAVELMGYNVTDSNGPNQTGFYDFQATMKDGQRCSTAKAYLVPKEHKRNLDIVAGAFVKKIIIKDRQAQGVKFDFGGHSREVRANKEVILSAGTINSPKLLMLSGVGPREELRKHKIPVQADLPVGQNLQEQWGALMNFELSDEIAPFAEKIKSNTSIWNYISSKIGPLTSISGVSNMAFLSVHGYPAPDDYPDYELYFGEGLHEQVKRLKIRSEYHRAIYEPYKNKPFYWCLSQILHPKGRGTVTLNSSDPYDPPVIDPNYFSHPGDIDVVVAGMKTCKEFGTSEPLKKIGSKLFSTTYPGCENDVNDDDEYFRCMAKSIAITCSHQVGTVKMGDPNDLNTVLDPQLRVKTISNLRVVDASVMPSITTGNFVPTIMIGEKASDMIKENIHCD